MRRNLAVTLAAAVTGVALLPAAAQAQDTKPASSGPAASPTTFPDTPLGRLARNLLDLMNARDSTGIARFVETRFNQDERGRTPATITNMLYKAGVQSGGLEVQRIRPMDPFIRVFTRPRNASTMLGIELEISATDTTRINHVMLVSLDPRHSQGGRPQPWTTERLAEDQLASLIREKIRQAADSDRFSGVVLVAKGGRVLVHEAYGYADRERGIRNSTRTRFPVYSAGKMFAGVAIAQLVEKGLLRWDDTVAKILPEYPHGESARRVTVRQLATHTAGVPEPFRSPRFHTADPASSHLALLSTFADTPIHGTPGEGHVYSNGNFVTLGAIVEKLSGRSYEEYLRRHVWRPAGMTQVEHPAWRPSADVAIGYAHFTAHDPLGIEPRRPAQDARQTRRGVIRGFGMGAFTAEDLYRFMWALRSGKLVGAAMAADVTTGKVSVGGPMKYGFGFYDQPMNGARIVGHPGSNPDTGHDADVEMVWDSEWIVVVLANYDAPAGMMLAGPILDVLTRQEGGFATPH